jgi:hypothetical protein
MLNIFTHQGSGNQNYIENPSHPSQNGYHQENKEQQIADEDVGKFHCWWECKLVVTLEISMEVPKKIKVQK